MSRTRRHRKHGGKAMIATSWQKILGGSRRRSRRYRGGFLGQILKQAAVPLALLAGQQHFKGSRRRRHK